MLFLFVEANIAISQVLYDKLKETLLSPLLHKFSQFLSLYPLDKVFVIFLFLLEIPPSFIFYVIQICRVVIRSWTSH